MNDNYYELGFIVLFFYSKPKFSFYDSLMSMKSKVLKQTYLEIQNYYD